MEISLNELLQGKSTLIKNKEYFSTAAYVEPFLERMSKYTDNFLIQAKLPDQISITKKEDLSSQDIVWNRVWVQAVLPNSMSYDNHEKVVGMVYGLDVRKPVVKFYTGGLNKACLNLCIFNPDMLSVRELEPEKSIDYRIVSQFAEKEDEISKYLTTLKNTEIPYKESVVSERLGDWVRNALNKTYDTGFNKVKLATTVPIDAYKLIYEDKESPYYVGHGNPTDMFNVYNAFTELITNDGNAKSGAKDIINKADKTLLLKEILSI